MAAGNHGCLPNGGVVTEFFSLVVWNLEQDSITPVSWSCLNARLAARDIFGGGEDTHLTSCEVVNWCARTGESGFDVCYNPGAVIVHKGEVVGV